MELSISKCWRRYEDNARRILGTSIFKVKFIVENFDEMQPNFMSVFLVPGTRNMGYSCIFETIIMIMESMKCAFVPPGGGDAMMQRTFWSTDVDGLPHTAHPVPATYHPSPQWIVSSNKLEQKGKCSEIRCFCSSELFVYRCRRRRSPAHKRQATRTWRLKSTQRMCYSEKQLHNLSWICFRNTNPVETEASSPFTSSQNKWRKSDVADGRHVAGMYGEWKTRTLSNDIRQRMKEEL